MTFLSDLNSTLTDPLALAGDMPENLRDALKLNEAPVTTSGIAALVGIDNDGKAIQVVAQTQASFATIAVASTFELGNLSEIQIRRWSISSPFMTANYLKTPVLPAHSAFFTAADGTFWELNEKNPHGFMTGVVGDGVADDTAAIQRAVDYVRIKWGGGNVYLNGAICGVSSPVNIRTSGIVISGVVGNPGYIRRLADTGALVAVGSGMSTVVGRSGIYWLQLQDLTNIGTWANSPYGLTFTNCTDAIQDHYELYCESMLWAGVFSTKVGNGKIFYAGGEKSYAAGRIAWLVTKHAIGSGHQSTEIWDWGHVDIQCGKVTGGGTTITSYCDTGLKVNCCDGFEASVHIQGPADAAITLESFASSGFDLTNVTLVKPFVDLSNGHGIKIQGDTAIIGLCINDAIVSHKGLGSTNVRNGVLVTGIVKDASIVIARGDGTMGDLISIQNASAGGYLRVNRAQNIGCKTVNTFDVVSIAQGTDWATELGVVDGNSKTRAVTFFGASALRCSTRVDHATNVQDGVLFNNTSNTCTVLSSDLQSATIAAVSGHTAATAAKIRGCTGISNYG